MRKTVAILSVLAVTAVLSVEVMAMGMRSSGLGSSSGYGASMGTGTTDDGYVAGSGMVTGTTGSGYGMGSGTTGSGYGMGSGSVMYGTYLTPEIATKYLTFEKAVLSLRQQLLDENILLLTEQAKTTLDQTAIQKIKDKMYDLRQQIAEQAVQAQVAGHGVSY